MWVVPRVAKLLDVAWVRRRSKNNTGSVTFESQINSAKNVEYLCNQIYGRSHLLSSTLLTCTMAGVEMLVSDSSLIASGVAAATFPAPLPLPRPSKRMTADESTVSILIKPLTGHLEVTHSLQKVMAARMSVPSAQSAAAPKLHKQSALLSGLLQRGQASSVSSLHYNSRSMDNHVDSCVVEAVVALTASHMAPLQSPLTWVRTIEHISFNLGSHERMESISMDLSEEDSWAVTNARALGSDSAVTLKNLIVGEHDLPPTSPGPLSAQTPRAAENEEDEIDQIPADHPLLLMTEEERLIHIQSQVMNEVKQVVGHAIHPEEPLMTAGLDSRGGMELRRILAESLGLELPVTLLYDYQSIEDIVGYINGVVTSSEEKALSPGTDEDSEEAYVVKGRRDVRAPQPQVSKLMKTLRPPAQARPLFLAAPGVANAQSAYFAFSMFLQWSTQPIYVLDKDNDLDLKALALQNAEDMVLIQPEGPYLVGGHSYGGAVAVEIAMVLESWGKEVGLVLIMDTPLKPQIREQKPEATEATDEDCLELMEMILGALGRDALGMGSSIAHPKESDEWKGMTMDQKYEFFAPIWRVMRDSNMSVEEVKEQIEYVALVTKQGSQISDLRGHEFSNHHLLSPVVYFRAFVPGVCTYFDDRKGPNVPYPHGACWYERCLDLRVIDVPGDHFSLLRQDLEDMNILVTGLKTVLGPFGWSETISREDKPQYSVSANEIRDIDSYLKKMGVDDPGLRRRLEVAMPYATEEGVGSAFTGSSKDQISAINRAGKAWQEQTGSGDVEALLIVCCEANGTLGGLETIFSNVDIPAFAVHLPQDNLLWEAPDLNELATVAMKALQRTIPMNKPVVVGGVGFGGLLAHELALHLDGLNDNVCTLALFEGLYTIKDNTQVSQLLSEEAAVDTCQAAVALYPLILETMGPKAPPLDEIVIRLAETPAFDEQLDYLASFRPENLSVAEWDIKVDVTLSRLGYYKTVSDSYSPVDIFPGQSLVFSSSEVISQISEMDHEDAAHIINGPNNVWEPIRFLVQPVTFHYLNRKDHHAASTLTRHILEAIWRRKDAEQRATGVSALPLMSPRMHDVSPQPDSMDEDIGSLSTVCVVSPLNRLCPERRYILRHIGKTGTPAQMASAPLARIPLWMTHSERGDISGAQKELAAMLRVPCYGLALGPDAEECTDTEELAASYCAAMIEMQPSGPYLLAGTSVTGCVIAQAMARYLHNSGKQTGLILLDGCISPPNIPLHDTTWYGLFYLLKEIGSLQSSIGEFVDFVQGAGSPTQQLKFITSFKPSDPSVPVAAWETAVYATLDRAASLKRMGIQPHVGTDTYEGPTAIIVPKDRVGKSLLDASTPYVDDPKGPLSLTVDERHTECLMSRQGRQHVAEKLALALEYLLKRTG